MRFADFRKEDLGKSRDAAMLAFPYLANNHVGQETAEQSEDGFELVHAL